MHSGSKLLNLVQTVLQSHVAQIVMLILISRVVLLAVGALTYVVVQQPNINQLDLSAANLQGFRQPFGYADVSWYIDIATNGYTEKPFSEYEKANWAFFPLWPLLLRVSNALFNDMILPGMAMSIGFFTLGVAGLYQLLRLDFNVETAKATTLLLAAFPAAYFTLRPGPESLFIALSVGCFLAARYTQWFLAGTLAMLATLTRLQGILLIIPLVFMYYRQYRASGEHRPGILSLALPPLALLGLMWHIYTLSGHPFGLFAIQRSWDVALTYPYASVVAFFNQPTLIDYYGWNITPISIIFIIGASILTILMLRDRQMPFEYTAYTIFSLFLVVARSNTNASLRYMLPIFPLFIILARLTAHRSGVYTAIVVSFITLQVLYFVFFVQMYNWAAT